MDKADQKKAVGTRRAVARAQAIVRRYVSKKRSLSEELIRERRGEAACG